MKLVEFRRKVNEFNKSGNVYKIVLDEDFKMGTYKRMSIFPGVMVVPYIIEDVFISAYYVNDFRLLPYIEMDIKSEGRTSLKIPSPAYKRLYKNKIKNANKILCGENTFYELKYLFDKGLIRDADFYKQFKNKNTSYDEMAIFLNDNKLSTITVEREHIEITNPKTFEVVTIPISDLCKYSNEPCFFNLRRNEMLLNANMLASLYDNYLSKLETLYNRKYLQCDTSSNLNKEIKSLLYNIVRLYNTTKHFSSHAKLFRILDSFSDINKLKDSELEFNKAILMLLRDKKFIEDLAISPEVVTYSKSLLSREDCLLKVKSEDVDINTFAEFKGFVYEVNRRHKDIKLVIDYDCSKNLYSKAKKLLGVIPYIVYLKENNKLIVCYTCFRNQSLESLIKYKNEPIKKKLTKNDLNKIATYSYNHIESCIFRPTVYKTFKYLHIMGILKDNDLLVEGAGFKLVNMHSLLSIVPLNHIVFRDNNLYLRLPGLYKQKDFKCKIKYDEDLKEFYTLLKVQLGSWSNIDNIVCSIDFLSNSSKSLEFSEVCESMANETLVKIRRKQKIKSNIETLEQMYLECKRFKHKNLLTDIFDRIIKGNIRDIHEEQLAKNINISRINCKRIKVKI